MLARSLARAGVFALTGPPNDAAWSRATADNPVLSPHAGNWNQKSVDNPSVIFDGSAWHGWYAGDGTVDGAFMGAMDSSDGIAWTWHLTGGLDVPVLGTGGGSNIYQPNVQEFAGTFYAFYADGNSGHKLYVATSSDGYSWSIVGTDILAFPSGVNQWASAAVIKIGSTYYMLVEGRLTSDGHYDTFYATSSSLTSGWTIGNGGSPLSSLTPSGCPGASGPNLTLMSDGLIHLYYHAGPVPTSDIYTATISQANLVSSPNSWTIGNGGSPILTHSGSGDEVDQLADPSVLLIGSTWYLYCGAVWNQSPFQADLILATAAAT